jgi:hypothetical protein
VTDFQPFENSKKPLKTIAHCDFAPRFLPTKIREEPIKEACLEVEKGLSDAARQTRAMLLPTANYFASLLDHELAVAMVSARDWDPIRLAIVAAALVRLDNRQLQVRRVQEAISRIAQGLSSRGVFPLGWPEFVVGGGQRVVFPGEAIVAYAELLRVAPMGDLDEGFLDLVKRMMRFFEDTRARHPSIDVELSTPEWAETTTKIEVDQQKWKYLGWHLFRAEPRSFHPQATLVAIQAHAHINFMLDEKINQMILEHFSVKKPNEELDSKLNLDSIFYPDYGLTAASALAATSPAESMLNDKQGTGTPNAGTKKKPRGLLDSEWPDHFGREESIAITLQRMRAHVQHNGMKALGEDTLCSLALHGPPGTGKTTLVEALAQSCGVPLVEVTPSDIIIGGEEAIESQARTVFKALSLLTRAVILFDEFDPVLWRREQDPTERSVYTFLTPGMLPKLKDLHKSAKKRSSVFVLSTNLIGGLDEAAVREGRFDRKVGIYPPDPLSRVGRLLNQIDKFLDNAEVRSTEIKRPPRDELIRRVREIVQDTKGGAMETLGRPDWFSAPEASRAKDIKADLENAGNGSLNPFDYIFRNGAGWKRKSPAKEAHLTEDKLFKQNTAILEFGQWWWIDVYEERVIAEFNKGSALSEAFKCYPGEGNDLDKFIERLQGWIEDKGSSQKSKQTAVASPNRSGTVLPAWVNRWRRFTTASSAQRRGETQSE